MEKSTAGKQARILFKKAGWSLFFFSLVFTLVEQFSLSFFAGNIWKFTMLSTPNGFISNANIVDALIHSPWVVFVLVLIVIIYAAVYMWHVTAVIIGIAYIYEDKRITVIDLLKQSFFKTLNSFKPHNWLILLYSLLIVPFANIYQVSKAINAYVIPEYIQDFIYSKVSLSILSLIVTIFAIYIALKWFFVLPSFILKHDNFKDALEESKELTKKGMLKNGFKMTFYNIVENIRLAAVPFILLVITLAILYVTTYDKVYAFDLITILGVNDGFDMMGSLVGLFVYLSTMCFLFVMYIRRLKEEGKDSDIVLPEIQKQGKAHESIFGIELIFTGLIILLVVIQCLGSIYVAQKKDEFIFTVFGRTDIVAHKGYSSRAPENTMMAFDLAHKSDHVDYIELDVWNSKDGIPVVIHNESIYDATGINGNIYDYAYEELCNISAPYSWDKEKFKNARIPSLEEVLESYSSTTPFLIEIKGYQQDETLVKKIVDLMEKYGCLESSMIHSGDYSALKAVKEINPDIRCGLIQAIVTGDCYDLPYVDFMSVEHTFVNNEMVRQLHLRGKKIYVWTVNYESSAQALKFMGVDGIITDMPDEISEYVAARNNLFETAIKRVAERNFNSDFAQGNY